MIKMANSRPIFIYIDNSNLFIEAKSKKVRDDPRARLDIGKVCDVVAAGRPVAQTFLYGSEPPKVDTVWDKIRGQDVDVVVHKKSRAGKEKKVDTQIVADIAERACLTPIKERSTIVVVTGDADMIPGIEKALQNKWKVEVAMWEHAMSADYKEIEVKIINLNKHLVEITFNRMCSISDLSTSDLNKSAVVLKVREETFEEWHYRKDWFPEEEWCEKVEALAKCKFQYDWADFEDSQETRIFGLVLCFKKDGGKDNFIAKYKEEELVAKFIISVKEFCYYTPSMETKVWNGSEREVACLRDKRGQKRSYSDAVKNEDNNENEDTANKKPNNS